MASYVTRNQHVITGEIFDLPCALKAPKSFDAVDWKVNSFFIMSLNHLGVGIIVENLLAKNSVSSVSENVRVHQIAIGCLLQLNIFALRRSQTLIKSHSSFRHVQKISCNSKRKKSRAVQSQLKKVTQSLKVRKLRQKHKKML